ncbi:YqhR family membrane protein [Paenibacillus humicola]|uniref:YqhR family membrane protein n=1 Tax=Paenibacillus humicola TaxID=3110540 RepID=UPI00237A7BA5|nr:YqhR family membrane protein [Paenibacillus humicola]
MAHAHRKPNLHRLRERRRNVTNPAGYSLMIGFFAGLLWGGLRWLLYIVHFTHVIPAFLLDPFFRLSFLKTGWGQLAGLGGFILFSIAAALIYYYTLGRIAGPWPGLVYGFFWWCVWFAAVGPLLRMMEPLHKIGYDSMTTELCVFLMWGLFIGYSIAYEFNDETSREPVKLF